MGVVTKEVKHLRELLEKDIGYIKEKVDRLNNKFDDELKPIKEETKLNTRFREKFKWTAALITGFASFVSFVIMLVGFKLQWF